MKRRLRGSSGCLFAPRRVLCGALVLGAALGWMMFLRPSTMGGPAGYVIVSGSSMEPLLRTGDLAVVRRQAVYSSGDVVAYAIPDGHVGHGMLVIHRIIGGSQDDGLLLQGDNRGNPDLWRPRHEDVAGALQWHIPHGGTALFLLRSPLVVAVAAGLTGFWFVALREPRDDQATCAPAPADPTPPPLHVITEQGADARPVVAAAGAPPRRELVAPLALGLAIGLLAAGLKPER